MHAAEVPYIAVVGASQATEADMVDAEAVGRLLGAAGADRSSAAGVGE